MVDALCHSILPARRGDVLVFVLSEFESVNGQQRENGTYHAADEDEPHVVPGNSLSCGNIRFHHPDITGGFEMVARRRLTFRHRSLLSGCAASIAAPVEVNLPGFKSFHWPSANRKAGFSPGHRSRCPGQRRAALSHFCNDGAGMIAGLVSHRQIAPGLDCR
jgi:hypothetical protein